MSGIQSFMVLGIDLCDFDPATDGELRDEQVLVVFSSDLDRVTAERDALQQRLNAADQREDALGSLVPEAELALKALNVAVSVYDVELADSARRGLRLIIAALKPAEAARCANCDRATVEQCDDAGCGFLGAGNGAPE
ncbi:hypothetical protein BOP96_12145 [Pseudomonas sp. FSL W5-0203]|uniref:hypothetical protein n=1 Tax=Pseudomonas sp. FSL W5-0203 TaxID=1920491 RepID=UPI000935E93C|nr:hypothetical protein [Pseudomonas sp. FSL W5-0203]OJT30199.1 hypothetical protein BOP96_12145 [Pseudomonas sp. FSL W5-0203]